MAIAGAAHKMGLPNSQFHRLYDVKLGQTAPLHKLAYTKRLVYHRQVVFNSHNSISLLDGQTSGGRQLRKPTKGFTAALLCIGLIGAFISAVPSGAAVPQALNQVQGNDLCDGLTATINGTEGDDVITGTSGADIIFTYGGFDRVDAGGGDDTICSGLGRDIVKGGPGNDSIYDEGGISYLQGNAGDDMIFSGSGNDFLYGQDGNDTLISPSGNNRMYGGTGGDTLTAGPGDDFLTGHAGDDTLDAGAGDDTLSGGSGDDVLNSGDGDDSSHGQSGDDELNGGAGNDDIIGGLGSDTMRGGAGTDTCNGNVQPGDTDKATECETSLNITSDGSDKPKLIFYVMLDDADYHDVGYNSTDAVTPNIDALREDGVTLDNFYSSSGICSPTRVGTLTGNSPLRYGLSRLWPDTSSRNAPEPPEKYFSALRGLPDDIPFISDISEEGYKSFHIGKWHAGDSKESFLPNARGFDKSIIMKASPYEGALQAKVDGTWQQTPPQEWRPQYMADQIVDYIDSNKDAGNMFVNWWAIAPHTPLYVPPGFDNAPHDFDLDTNRGKLLATLYEWDKQFGRVVSYLKDEGLYDDSMIVFTSDNGGYRFATSPDRDVSGAKNTLSEGGIRVPFVATWPNGLPAGVTRSTPASTHDLLPTFFEVAGRNVPSGIDGQSFLSELQTGDGDARDPIYWQLRTRSWRTTTKEPGGFGPGTDLTFDDRAFDTFALRDGCYKIVRESADPAGNVDAQPYKLYNVCEDISESNDLRLTEPALFNRLKSELLAERLKVAKLSQVPTNVADGGTTIPFDARLDTHQDDISFYTTVNGYQQGETPEIYNRGDGLSIEIDNTGKVIVEVKGPSDKNRSNPAMKTVRLVHQLDPDQTTFKLGFVVHNYWKHGASMELYINDSLVRRIAAPFATSSTIDQIGGSIYALDNSEDDLVLGDSGISLGQTALYASALRPDEL